MYQSGYPSRSPPPLQHPIPTHPPFQVPDPPVSPHPGPRNSTSSSTADSTTADPNLSAARPRGSVSSSSYVQGGYQRFSSPPIHSQQANAYAPSFGQGAAAYSVPQPGPNFYASSQQGVGGQMGPAAAGAPGVQGWGAFPGLGASGGVMNDATAQMGVQFGQHMAQVGGEYVQKNFNALLPLPLLKHYFNVSNSYVLHKLRIVLFPWRHKPWSRAHRQSNNGGGAYAGMGGAAHDSGSGSKAADGYLPPRDDVNSPDLYIPVMAFVTYILLTSMIYGLESRFHPEILGLTASRALAIILMELAAIKLGTYLLNIQGDHTFVDLLAYSGYKFVGTLITLFFGLVNVRGWIYWSVFLYCFAANAFFLLRSLRYVVLPDPSNPSSVTITHAQRSRRIQFLFSIAVSQIVMGWLLIVGIFH
ncbi:Protein transport protein yif1 [Thecaphora frezii]